eukprot:12972035-Alexandrium_andersonii.AAC.1
MRRCAVEARRPFMFTRERLSEYRLLVALDAPGPLAQASQAELALVELHSAPECSGNGFAGLER